MLKGEERKGKERGRGSKNKKINNTGLLVCVCERRRRSKLPDRTHLMTFIKMICLLTPSAGSGLQGSLATPRTLSRSHGHVESFLDKQEDSPPLALLCFACLLTQHTHTHTLTSCGGCSGAGARCLCQLLCGVCRESHPTPNNVHNCSGADRAARRSITGMMERERAVVVGV